MQLYFDFVHAPVSNVNNILPPFFFQKLDLTSVALLRSTVNAKATAWQHNKFNTVVEMSTKKKRSPHIKNDSWVVIAPGNVIIYLLS